MEWNRETECQPNHVGGPLPANRRSQTPVIAAKRRQVGEVVLHRGEAKRGTRLCGHPGPRRPS